MTNGDAGVLRLRGETEIVFCFGVCDACSLLFFLSCLRPVTFIPFGFHRTSLNLHVTFREKSIAKYPSDIEAWFSRGLLAICSATKSQRTTKGTFFSRYIRHRGVRPEINDEKRSPLSRAHFTMRLSRTVLRWRNRTRRMYDFFSVRTYASHHIYK